MDLKCLIIIFQLKYWILLKISNIVRNWKLFSLFLKRIELITNKHPISTNKINFKVFITDA